MKRKWIIAAACAVLLSGMEAMACTGLLVGKKASVDGSVMISYAADSHTLYGELYRWPAVRIDLTDVSPEDMNLLRAGMMVETEALKRH